MRIHIKSEEVKLCLKVFLLIASLLTATFLARENTVLTEAGIVLFWGMGAIAGWATGLIDLSSSIEKNEKESKYDE